MGGVTEPPSDAPAVFPALDPAQAKPPPLPPPSGPAQTYQGGLYRPPVKPAWPPPQPAAAPPAPVYVQPVGVPVPVAVPYYVPTPPAQIYVRPPRDHHVVLHLVLTAVTCGLWLPFWLLIEFGGSMWAVLRRLFVRG